MVQLMQLHRRGEIDGRLDDDDVAALGSQNVLDDHSILPGSGRGGLTRNFRVWATIRPEAGSVK